MTIALPAQYRSKMVKGLIKQGTSDLPQTALRRLQGRSGLGVRERRVLDVLKRAVPKGFPLVTTTP